METFISNSFLFINAYEKKRKKKAMNFHDLARLVLSSARLRVVCDCTAQEIP